MRATAPAGTELAEVVLSHRTEGSVLRDGRARHLIAYAVHGRRRYATCSGVAWFGQRHLAVVNLYGRHLRIYRFHEACPARGEPARLELLHQLRDVLDYPENVAVSPDGRLLAITHSSSDRQGVSLHTMDPVSLAPSRGEVLRGSDGFHGTCFSASSRHLGFTRVGTPSCIEILRVADRASTCFLENTRMPLKPKSLAFTPDGRFVVVAWALNVGTESRVQPIGGLSVHAFDDASGVMQREPIAELHDPGDLLAGIEACAVLPTASPAKHVVLASNQRAGLAAAFDLDAVTGSLRPMGVLLTRLSFPHGIAASANGNLFAVTSYGSDALIIARPLWPA